MARTYEPKGFAFVFVYAREAHPGEHFPAHRSMEQKLRHARAFKAEFGVERPILVDDLAGTGHRLYGKLPNMTYLVGRGGKVLFRADWTDAPTIEVVMEHLLAGRARRRAGARLVPFYAELVGYRWSDQETFREGLRRAGPQAVDDFQRVMQRWTQHGLPSGRITLNE